MTDAVSAVLLAGVSTTRSGRCCGRSIRGRGGDHDVVSLMTAVPSLVRAVRYGNVRGTPTQALTAVVDALVRICAGLPGGAGGLADDAAARLRDAMDGLHAALAVYGRGRGLGIGPSGERWRRAAPLAGRRDVHGLVAGRVTRMLADAGVLSWAAASVRFRAALSVGVPAAAKAHWAEGFLGRFRRDGAAAGGGLLLVHDRELLGVLDDWVTSLRTRSSWRCCRCCAGPSASSPRRSGRPSGEPRGHCGRGADRARARGPWPGGAGIDGAGRRGRCGRSRSS